MGCDKVQIKGITMEDFVNYKFPSLFLASCFCNFKCCLESHLDISTCQNEPLAQSPVQEVSDELIYDKYISNPITKSVVIGGLEPFMQYEELLSLISLFRSRGCLDPFVIYTGYREDELQEQIQELSQFPNIIIKFGRFVPGQKRHLDPVLGVELASENQYGKQIS